MCWSPWGCKEQGTTERLNWTDWMGLDTMIFIFWMFSFKPDFSLSSFIFIKKFFSSSSFSAIRVLESAYLRLLIFVLAISHGIIYIYIKKARWQYTALKYSFPKFAPVCSSMSDCNCCFFSFTQVSQEASQVVWYSHSFKNFPQICCDPPLGHSDMT